MRKTNPDDSHCVRWVGYEGDLITDELWQFGGNGIRKRRQPPPERSFTEYGGETLCGLQIESGSNMYTHRWRSIQPDGHPADTPDLDNMQLALIALHGITCKICRNILVYGISRIIEDLSFIRSTLVGDWVGENYISRDPLIHAKHVVSSDQNGAFRSETYQFWCEAAWDEINPQMAHDEEERDRITCPDCLAKLAAKTVP